jgi:hypothetical protein
MGNRQPDLPGLNRGDKSRTVENLVQMARIHGKMSESGKRHSAYSRGDAFVTFVQPIVPISTTEQKGFFYQINSYACLKQKLHM